MIKKDSIKTFSYNGYTLDLFIDIANDYKYAITVFTIEEGTFSFTALRTYTRPLICLICIQRTY